MKTEKQMNRYWKVIREYYRFHKKKTRVTTACIAAAICMIAAVFSLADVGVGVETQAIQNIYGNYHIKVSGLSLAAPVMEPSEEIAHAGWLFELPAGTWNGKACRILAGDADMMEQFHVKLLEGRYAEGEKEAVIDKKAEKELGLQIGDTLSIEVDNQSYDWVITGISDTFSSLTARDTYGLMVSAAGGERLGNTSGDYYMTCRNVGDIENVKSELINTYQVEENRIQTNEMLLAAMGKGKSALAANLYGMAAILFCLVFFVSVLMIANCLYISAREKKRLYGLLRCIGAETKQLKKCVREEGKILWLRSIPAGVGGGVLLTWLCLLALRLLNPAMFGTVFVFQVSGVGIAAGVVTALAAVMAATVGPAKYVCAIPPLTAVKEEAASKKVKKQQRASTFRIPAEVLLSLRQAGQNKKSLFLMIFSFAMNIVLIFAFSVLVNFIYEGASFTKPYNPDASIYAPDGGNAIEEEIKQEIESLDGVKSVVGRKVGDAVLTKDGAEQGALLFSYDERQFEWIKSKIVSGSVNTDKLLTGEEMLVDEESGLSVGDTVRLRGQGGGAAVRVGGVLRNFPYDSSGGARCLLAETVFQQIEGETAYAILDIRFQKSDEALWEQVASLAGSFRILDYRQSKQESKNEFLTMAVFVYGFCGIIIAVTIFNIINCMNISVWNNLREYGVVCAVGGTLAQCERIVVGEALLYACGGGVLGLALGLPLHRYLYTQLVESYFHTVWKIPAAMAAMTLGIILLTAVLSSLTPLRQVKKINVVEMMRQG